MLRAAAVLLALGLAACAPGIPAGTPVAKSELSTLLPGRSTDFGNGVLISFRPDGTFKYDDIYENGGSQGTRQNIRWGQYGTYVIGEGQVCLRFEGTNERCDGIYRTADGGLVETVVGWPYRVVVR